MARRKSFQLSVLADSCRRDMQRSRPLHITVDSIPLHGRFFLSEVHRPYRVAAKANSKPPSMFLTFVRFLIPAGTSLSGPVRPVPSWPRLLSPHERALPLWRTAMELYAPPEIDFTFASPFTATGVLLLVPEPC